MFVEDSKADVSEFPELLVFENSFFCFVNSFCIVWQRYKSSSIRQELLSLHTLRTFSGVLDPLYRYYQAEVLVRGLRAIQSVRALKSESLKKSRSINTSVLCHDGK